MCGLLFRPGPLTDRDIEYERTGLFDPLDDAYDPVPLGREEIRRFIQQGYGDALRPRLWRAADSPERMMI